MLDIFFVNHKITPKVLLSENPFTFEKALLHGACCASVKREDDLADGGISERWHARMMKITGQFLRSDMAILSRW